MISTTPTVAEIDATINLLSILELAKDASKLKEALGGIKSAHDAVKADMAALDKLKAEVIKTQANVSVLQGRLDADREKLRVENQAHIRNCEALEQDRAAIKSEREKFDAWMAGEREKLAADLAKVASDRAAIENRAKELDAVRDNVAKQAMDAMRAQEAADAVRAEYETRMTALKAMVA